MILPFVGWAATGAIFFLKPGYAGAYELLAVKAYPLDGETQIVGDPSWLEARLLKTVLGEHLLVRTTEGWRHLDPHTRQERPPPGEEELRRLLSEAFSVNPSRYGQIASINGAAVTTDTGVRVTVNWERLSLAQRGADTDRIDLFYKIHYLQWTGIPSLDKVVGGTGIALVLALSLLGAVLFFRK